MKARGGLAVLSAGLALAAGYSPCQAAAAKNDGLPALVVEVMVNGKGPGRFVVDRSAETTTIYSQFAATLGFADDGRVGEAKAKLADGRIINGRSVRLDSIAVGQSEVKGSLANVVSVSHPELDGVLGLSFLGRFIARVDLVNRQLILDKRDVSQGDPRTQNEVRKLRLAPALGREYLPIELVVALVLAGALLLARVRKNPPTPHLGDPSFTLGRRIGEGGMGVVYEATDRNLDRKVAVKLLRGESVNDPAGHEELIREAKTVASLHHPNIIDIYNVVSRGGQAYIVFELIEGKTVAELLGEQQRMSLANAKIILNAVCFALEYAHERGIVHRDLKSSNVMVTNLGEVKVMDFGIARRLRADERAGSGLLKSSSPNSQLTDNLYGTVQYMAPEVMMGTISPQGDIYALGVMAYRILTGEHPFSPAAGIDERLQKIYTPATRRVAGLPPALDALIDAALEPDAAKRLTSARLFRERLAAII